MARIFVHIGLPKTATTTLQKDVFPHLNSKVLYLGICQPRTKPQSLLYERIIKAISDVKEVNSTNRMLRTQLSNDVDLLLSEEALCVSEEGLNWELKLNRLADILKGLDYKIIISVRKPYEAMHSYYVELFDLFKTKNSSFIDIALNDERMKIYHYSYFFSFLNQCFDLERIYLVKFDDIINGKLSALFEIFGYHAECKVFKIKDNNTKITIDDNIILERRYSILTILLQNKQLSYLVNRLGLKKYRNYYRPLFNIKVKKLIKLKKMKNDDSDNLKEVLRYDIEFVKNKFGIDLYE